MAKNHVFLKQGRKKQSGGLPGIYYKHKYSRLPMQFHTSSAAQGGGGSFKNRKHIGEVSCCESRMAERSHWWTDRWLRSLLFLSLFLSLSLTIYLPTHLSTYASIYLSLSLSVCLSTYLSASLQTKLFCETSSVFKTWRHQKRSKSARLLNFCTWQHQKRSNSARPPLF